MQLQLRSISSSWLDSNAIELLSSIALAVFRTTAPAAYLAFFALQQNRSRKKAITKMRGKMAMILLYPGQVPIFPTWLQTLCFGHFSPESTVPPIFCLGIFFLVAVSFSSACESRCTREEEGMNSLSQKKNWRRSWTCWTCWRQQLHDCTTASAQTAQGKRTPANKHTDAITSEMLY